MKRFVLDASISASWCLNDETNAIADALLESLPGSEIFVPSLWIVEMTNVLVVSERNGRISAVDAVGAMEMLTKLPIQVDAAELTLGERLSSLSVEYGLSAYDASYLELALRLRSPLATLDRSIAAAAKKSGLDLLV